MEELLPGDLFDKSKLGVANPEKDHAEEPSERSLFSTWILLLRCLEKVEKHLRNAIVKNGDESHGTSTVPKKSSNKKSKMMLETYPLIF